MIPHCGYFTGSNYHNRKEVRHNESKIKVKYYAQALSSQSMKPSQNPGE
jgi:hypothetical protein